jgi:hypothetical protein
MLKLKSFIISILLCSVAFTVNAKSKTDDAAMKNLPPEPVKNKVYDAMVGTWEGDSNAMGKKMHDRIEIRWGLNHQFIILKLKAIDVKHPKMMYEGLGIFGVDAQNKAKTFWFDSWGADAVSSGSGTFSDNKLEISDSNAMFKETRTFEIKGEKIIMHAKGTTKWQGKETSFDITTVYKKKK